MHEGSGARGWFWPPYPPLAMPLANVQLSGTDAAAPFWCCMITVLTLVTSIGEIINQKKFSNIFKPIFSSLLGHAIYHVLDMCYTYGLVRNIFVSENIYHCYTRSLGRQIATVKSNIYVYTIVYWHIDYFIFYVILLYRADKYLK